MMVLQVELETVSGGATSAKVGVALMHCVMSRMICAGLVMVNLLVVGPTVSLAVICGKTHLNSRYNNN